MNKTIFYFPVLVLLLVACNAAETNTNQSTTDRLDMAVEDEFVEEAEEDISSVAPVEDVYLSPDWQRNELKGRVQKVTERFSYTEGDDRTYTYYFSADGEQLRKGDFTPDNVKRDSHGRVIKTIENDGSDNPDGGYEFVYKYNSDGSVRQELYDAWEFHSETTYTYRDGLIVSQTENESSDAGEAKGKSTVTYSNFDEHGNWTNRIISASGTFTEWGEDGESESYSYKIFTKRTIVYY